MNPILTVHDSGLIQGLLFVTNSTGNCHIVDQRGQTACGLMEVELDEIQADGDGRVNLGKTPWDNYHYGVIHEDGRWVVPNKHRLCTPCDEAVPDELQAELFSHTELFERVDGLVTDMSEVASVA